MHCTAYRPRWFSRKSVCTARKTSAWYDRSKRRHTGLAGRIKRCWLVFTSSTRSTKCNRTQPRLFHTGGNFSFMLPVSSEGHLCSARAVRHFGHFNRSFYLLTYFSKHATTRSAWPHNASVDSWRSDRTLDHPFTGACNEYIWLGTHSSIFGYVCNLYVCVCVFVCVCTFLFLNFLLPFHGEIKM